MKKPDLTSLLAAATLFLSFGAVAVQAQDDTPPPPPSTSDQPGANWRANMLKRFDANKDGKLDDAEKATARESVSKEMRSRMEQNPRFLKRADSDNDGKLSDDEWAAAREKFQDHPRARKEHIKRRLQADRQAGHKGKVAMMRDPDFRRGFLLGRYDVNNDRKLDETERAAVRADMEKRIRAQMEKKLTRLKAIDADGDGKISDTEWASAKEQFKHKMPGMHDGPRRGPMGPDASDDIPPPPEE